MELNHNIEEGSILKGISKENPFKTPESYFNNITEQYSNTNDLSQKITQTGFKTPEHYFKNFTVKTPLKLIKLIPYVSVAAAILVGVFIYNSQISNTELDGLAIELQDDEILDYLSYEDHLGIEEIINYSETLEISLDEFNTNF